MSKANTDSMDIDPVVKDEQESDPVVKDEKESDPMVTDEQSPVKTKKKRKSRDTREKKPKRKRAEDEETKPETKKKKEKKRRTKKVKSPLEAMCEEGATAFQMKKKINECLATTGTFKVPKSITKALKAVTKHESVIEDEDLSQEVLELYNQAKRLECVKYMAEVLLYYETEHHLDLRYKSSKDRNIVPSALSKPSVRLFDKLKELYDFNLCGIEEQHHRYRDFLLDQVSPRDKPKQKRPDVSEKQGKRKREPKYLPYNLFIQEQWKQRKEEFNKISNIGDVMKLLSKEWQGNPGLKDEYKEKSDNLNAEKEKQQQQQQQSNDEMVVEQAPVM